jgi:hypothetical protein
VLSSDVELVECEQGIIPSRIRLQRFEDVSGVGREGLYQFITFESPLGKLGGVGGDRKIHFMPPKYRVALGNRHGEQVEATADTIDDSTRLGVEDGWKGLNITELNEVLSHLRVSLSDETIMFVVDPGFEPLFECWDMGYGPVDTGLGV